METHVSFGEALKRIFRKADPQGAYAQIEAWINSGEPVDYPALRWEFKVGKAAADAMSAEVRSHRFAALLEEASKRDILDRASLREAAVALGMSSASIEQQMRDFEEGLVASTLSDILADQRMDQSEEAILEVLSEKLGRLELRSDQRLALHQAREYERALTMPLEEVAAPVLLKPGEACYYVVQCEAAEVRQRTVTVGYAGTSVRVPLGHGVSYTAGTRTAVRVKEDFHHNFGDGALCLTNKRLLWIGLQRSISISNNSIVRVEPYLDGVEVRKGTGKPIMFLWGIQDRAATLMVQRVSEECR